MIFDNLAPAQISGDGVVSCRFSDVTLLPQSYRITLRARSGNGLDPLTSTIVDAGTFEVAGTAEDYGMSGPFADTALNHDTPLIVPYQWTLPDGTVATPSWQIKGVSQL